MGLINTAFSTAKGLLADQWKEYFYCESMPADVLAVKARKRVSKGSTNKGNDNIISDGSVIAVADGQCMMIVEQGKVVDLCAEPGEYIYDISSEPSIFSGSLGDSIKDVLKQAAKRFTFAGDTAKDQRVYFFNLKEITGNKYGTPNPVPFRVVDRNIGLDVDIAIRCFGEYSYHIVNPVLFYTNICGNVSSDYSRTNIDSQLKTEILTALQPAFAKISEQGIRYSALPGHAYEMAAAMNEVLSGKWRDLRGIEIVSFGVSSATASEEDEKMIKELQRNAAFRDPTMAAAHLVGAQASAMQSAAANTAGAATAFYGMNMASQAGGFNPAALYNTAYAAQSVQPQQNAYQSRPVQTAPVNTAPSNAWQCPTCGSMNQGKFCMECGTKKPAGALLYRCDKCGWEPDDPTNPPKFCPNCGDPFNAEDIIG